MATAKTQKEPAPFRRLVTGTQLGEIVGVTPSRISHLLKEGLPRDSATRKYDVGVVLPWFIERAAGNAPIIRGGVRAGYYAACAERQHIEAARLKGDVIPRVEVDLWLAATFVEFREHLLAIPERVTRDRTVAAKLDAGVQRELHRLADGFEKWAAEPEPPTRTIEAATKAPVKNSGRRRSNGKRRATRRKAP